MTKIYTASVHCRSAKLLRAGKMHYVSWLSLTIVLVAILACVSPAPPPYLSQPPKQPSSSTERIGLHLTLWQACCDKENDGDAEDEVYLWVLGGDVPAVRIPNPNWIPTNPVFGISCDGKRCYWRLQEIAGKDCHCLNGAKNPKHSGDPTGDLN